MDERTAAYYTRNAGRLAADYQVAGSDYFATLDRVFEKAIKRLTPDATHWIFKSDNPAYELVHVPKNEITQPILGTMVEKLP